MSSYCACIEVVEVSVQWVHLCACHRLAPGVDQDCAQCLKGEHVRNGDSMMLPRNSATEGMIPLALLRGGSS